MRIGIDAPREVKVHREEVFRQIAEQNASAVASVDRADALRRRLAGGPPPPPRHPPRGDGRRTS